MAPSHHRASPLELRAACVTPLTGPLALYGRMAADAIALWADHAKLPEPFSAVALEVVDSHPNPARALRTVQHGQPHVLFGPYGGSPTRAAVAATQRVVWNHGGASDRLRWPDHPNVVNVLSSASSYFHGALELVAEADPGARTVLAVHGGTRFGREVVEGAAAYGSALGFGTRVYEVAADDPSVAQALPWADVLLAAGSFEQERLLAETLLDRPWRAAGFVGAGVAEVLATLGDRREGLLGPAQWLPSAALPADEGPDAGWFVDRYSARTGHEPAYPAAQAFAGGVLAARCIRDAGSAEDAAQLRAAANLACRTLYGDFRLDPRTGVQVGHRVLTVQWQDGARRVVWPPDSAQATARLPFRPRR